MLLLLLFGSVSLLCSVDILLLLFVLLVWLRVLWLLVVAVVLLVLLVVVVEEGQEALMSFTSTALRSSTNKMFWLQLKCRDRALAIYIMYADIYIER